MNWKAITKDSPKDGEVVETKIANLAIYHYDNTRIIIHRKTLYPANKAPNNN